MELSEILIKIAITCLIIFTAFFILLVFSASWHFIIVNLIEFICAFSLALFFTSLTCSVWT